MLLMSTMKFIVFLLSLTDIRSLAQKKKDVNPFFCFFSLFFLFFLLLTTITYLRKVLHIQMPALT